MKTPGLDHELKVQLARELCAIMDGYSLLSGALHLNTHESELSRLRRGDLRRFSLTRIIRYIARAGYDIEVHLKRVPRLEERPRPRLQPRSTIVRYDYYGLVVTPPPGEL